MEKKERKKIRLANYDYSSVGAYFITLCTKNKEHNLSRIIVGDGLPVPKKTAYGDVVEKYINEMKIKDCKPCCITVREGKRWTRSVGLEDENHHIKNG